MFEPCSSQNIKKQCKKKHLYYNFAPQRSSCDVFINEISSDQKKNLLLYLGTTGVKSNYKNTPELFMKIL